MFVAVGLQVATVAVLALIAGLFFDWTNAGFLVLGGLAAIIPNSLFALRLAIHRGRSAESYPAVFFLGEFAKIGLTVALIALIARVVESLNWLPLLIGVVAFTVMTTWQHGRGVVTDVRDRMEGSLRDFVRDLKERRAALPRIPGTAIFLNRGGVTTPLSMKANVDHNHVLHEHVIIVSIETPPVPRVPDSERITVDDLGYRDDGIFFVSARYGYMERPDVPAALRLVDPIDTEGRIDLDNASYFVSKVDLVAGPQHTMAPWRKRLFIAISHMTGDAAGYFGLPLERTVIIGARVEV
jgi:KUP system potassium uptake protein